MPPPAPRRFTVVSTVFACVLLAAGPAAADQCTSAKLRAIASREARLLRCQAKVARSGDPSLEAACDARAVANFPTAFGSAGMCSGVQSDCESLADDCRDKVRAALPDGTSAATASKCESVRLRTAGKATIRKLGCYARAARKGVPVDSAPGGCLDRAHTRFVAAFNKVTGCAGDGQADAVEAVIYAQCVGQPADSDDDGNVSGLCPAIPPACGNGSVDNGEQCDVPGSSCGGSALCRSDCTCPCDLTACPCDFLDPSVCLYPFPDDWFTVADASTDTGRRVHFPDVAMPRNASGTPMVASDYNLNDGFSPGASIIVRVPGVDLGMTGAAPITDIARSLDADAPIVLVNASTGEHHLMFAEIDSNASSEANRAVIIHPSVNLAEGTRYIVALRRMKDSSGTLIAPTADFIAYRDGTPTGAPVKEARRPHMEAIFTTLGAAGVDRSDLYLAWDFTVASERNLTERLLFVRDDGFMRLGTSAPSFTVDRVQDDVDANIFRRVTGTYMVERYVDSTMAPARFVLGPDGLPLHQSTPQPASFICIIPRAALPSASGPATPARASIYGHGLLGSNSEVSAGNVESMANEHNFVFCATKWIGMADEDIGNAAGILRDLGKFPSLTDRLQQAMLDQLFLARLMIHPAGFVSDPAFQDASSAPVIDTGAVFYDGNSQGGIFGGTVMSVAQDITRGVLGVPGMNYSLLLTRSSDFSTYAMFLYPAYPNELQRPLLLALIQML